MMMGMSLRQAFRKCQVQVLNLPVDGGLTGCCLPETAKLLMSKKQRGLKLIKKLHQEKEFRSVVDWLLFVFVREERKHILRFYKDAGPSMVALHTSRYIHWVDQQMVLAVELLNTLYNKGEAQGLGIGEISAQVQQEVDVIGEMLFSTMEA